MSWAYCIDHEAEVKRNLKSYTTCKYIKGSNNLTLCAITDYEDSKAHMLVYKITEAKKKMKITKLASGYKILT